MWQLAPLAALHCMLSLRAGVGELASWQPPGGEGVMAPLKASMTQRHPAAHMLSALTPLLSLALLPSLLPLTLPPSMACCAVGRHAHVCVLGPDGRRAHCGALLPTSAARTQGHGMPAASKLQQHSGCQ